MVLFNRYNVGIYCGIFLISFSTLILEITLTKIFSVTLWYHFSYMVISLAMFGIGFGGLLVYHFKESFKHGITNNLYMLSLAQAVSIVLSLHAALSYTLPSLFGLQDLMHFIMLYLLCTAPFVLSSMILSILFLNWPDRAAKIYGADLQGAAAGCIGCLVLISYFSAPQVILFSSLASIIAAVLFELPKVRMYSIFFIVFVLTLIVSSNSLFKVVQTKNHYSDKMNHIMFEKWSPLSRITVFPTVFFDKTENKTPFAWGISSTYKPQGKFNQLWIEQDASAGTPIVPFDGDYSKVDFLKYDITSLPYYLKKNAQVFILGVGGGRDVLTALLFNNKDITGVDIHPVIVDLIKNRYAQYTGNIYNNKYVHIKVSEGRNYLAQTNRRFDIIHIPLIDSWAATVAGAFAMTENSLYTTEAFVTYLNHLSPSGILSISRFYFTPDNQTIKTAILARAALEKMGVENPEKNIVILKNTKSTDKTVLSTILIKQEPFTGPELNQLKQLAAQLQFSIVYLPNYLQNEPLFQSALTTHNLSKFVADYYYDIRPNTDDRPFFFQMLYFSGINDFFNNTKMTGQTFNYYGVVVIFFLLIISTILVVLFYIVPIVLSTKANKLSLPWGAYFILLGMGFMFIEIPFLQQGSVYLGSPTYGLSVSLFGLLFFGGAGSTLSARFQHNQLVKVLIISLSIIVIISAALPFYFHFLMQDTLGQPLSIKLVLFVLILFPTALCMGVALPSGIRLAQYKFGSNIPWFWALNGVASVLGSIIAMAVSMIFGYNVTFTLGGVFYLLSIGSVFIMKAHARPLSSIVNECVPDTR